MKRVVVLGGGTAGLSVAQALSGNKDLSVTLIDRYAGADSPAVDFCKTETSHLDVLCGLKVDPLVASQQVLPRNPMGQCEGIYS